MPHENALPKLERKVKQAISDLQATRAINDGKGAIRLNVASVIQKRGTVFIRESFGGWKVYGQTHTILEIDPLLVKLKCWDVGSRYDGHGLSGRRFYKK